MNAQPLFTFEELTVLRTAFAAAVTQVYMFEVATFEVTVDTIEVSVHRSVIDGPFIKQDTASRVDLYVKHPAGHQIKTQVAFTEVPDASAIAATFVESLTKNRDGDKTPVEGNA